MYSVDNAHTITCEISDLIAQVQVKWTHKLRQYSDSPSFSSKTQTSVLTLSKAQIVELKKTGTKHAIACIFTAGIEYIAPSEIEIYTPGKSYNYSTTTSCTIRSEKSKEELNSWRTDSSMISHIFLDYGNAEISIVSYYHENDNLPLQPRHLPQWR